MSIRHKLNKLLAGISDSNLSLNEKDSCQFLCKNGLKCIVELIPQTTRSLAYIPIKRLPDSLAVRTATLEKALMLNLKLQQESSTSFVYDQRLEQITLCSQLDISACSFDEFDSWLGNMIKRSSRLKDELNQIEFSAASNVAQEQSPPERKQLNQVIHNAMLLKV